MAALLLVALFPFSGIAGTSASDDLFDSKTKVGEEMRRQAVYPALPLELPAETDARRLLMEMKDRLKGEKKLTTELELSIDKAVADIAAITAARVAIEREAAKPVHVIIDN